MAINRGMKIVLGLVLIVVLYAMIKHQTCKCIEESFVSKYMNPSMRQEKASSKEGFVSNMCPTTMVKRGNQILLYNPKLAKIPGVNPIVLESLKDYEEYVKWQRASNINCPILHLERIYDTQGSEQYEIKPSFLLDRPTGPLNHSLPGVPKRPNINELLNASYDNNKPYNANMYTAYDPHNQNIGQMTKLDSCGFNP